MSRSSYLKSALAGSASVLVLTSSAFAAQFNIPGGNLASALDAYAAQTGVQLLIADDAVRSARTRGVKGDLSARDALFRILAGTGYTTRGTASGAVGIVRDAPVPELTGFVATRIAATSAASAVESVVVTSSKIKGDIQTVPIAITALSQEQLTARQIAGGPDLVKEVPNLTFSKTNFTGYNIQIRGIGTQAISVTTDPAVAVAFNDTPFIRNHFFEQEFYDVNQVEVLRGPQGTLYGRNATAGVVNVVSAKPTDQFEAMLSADIGNYHNRRFEGMVNVPIVGDKIDLRVAGEWTKRDGYSFNEVTDKPIDGRDLWSSRITLGLKPLEDLQLYVIWEHFSENDDRMRTAKQLCHREPIAAVLGGDAAATNPFAASTDIFNAANYGSQGCQMSSLYTPQAFEVPNGFSLPYYFGAAAIGAPVTLNDPYLSRNQSQNLRVIESAFDPIYRAKNDVVELNADYSLSPVLTLTSQTAYNHDFLWSNEDFNRFTTAPGAFSTVYQDGRVIDDGGEVCDPLGGCRPTGYFCDPQLGCSDRLTAEDLSVETAWQLSQEFRLASNFKGPFNFTAGANYLHYETNEDYYVFINSLTLATAINGTACYGSNGCTPWVPGVSDNFSCLFGGFQYPNPSAPHSPGGCVYIDPNPVTNLDGNGHNYFRSKNPYVLNSYAAFGEANYDIAPDLKLIAGLRWTEDRKHFTDIPSELLVAGWGYPAVAVVDQKWNELTGRAVVNWTPKLDFTDQTLVYGSYAHGYKAGGANPPGAVLLTYGGGQLQTELSTPTHPLTFKPEFVDAFELGTKNTLFDGALTLNGDIFYYNYKSYQISEIVDRTSINLNFDARVKGAELEAMWEPLPGLRLNFAGGYEDARLAKGSKAIDLMDRTAGNPDWIVMKPFVTQSSNCVVPVYPIQEGFVVQCGAYVSYGPDSHMDPITNLPYVANPTIKYRPDAGDYIPITGYSGFDVSTAPNAGEGFYKYLSGNQLPNAPHFTTSLSAEYTMPLSEDWAGTLHSDFYWQSQSYARVFNDRPYDKIRGYSNMNLALILTSADGWQAMGYVKNVFDKTAITGTFLNSDDTGLTTNVFLTDPRLYGVRITRQFDGGGLDIFSNDGGKPPQLWLTFGGAFNNRVDAKNDPYDPLASDHFPNGGSATPVWADGLVTPAQLQKDPTAGFDWEGALTYQPEGSDWVLKAGIRYGRSSHNESVRESQFALTRTQWEVFPGFTIACSVVDQQGPAYSDVCRHGAVPEFADSRNHTAERHTMMDFEIGRNVGIGSFGTSTISGGVRVAQFNSNSGLILGAIPLYDQSAKYHGNFDIRSDEKRSFHGVGPKLSWDATQPLWGDTGNGAISFDWGVNAALLFGQQNVNLNHSVQHCSLYGFGGFGSNSGCLNEPPDSVSRSTNVTVPNLGGHLGVSLNYNNAKISFGYRADEFFGAIDGGQNTAKKYNRGFFGPYLNLSVGFGG